MTCCQCQGLETFFDKKIAARELKKYRKKGPNKTTRLLIDALKADGVEGSTLLDIGGGVGAIQHELLEAGASHATSVDASSAYLKTAKEEAERRGHADRVRYHYGDFVELAAEIPPAEIVTLDRVICCYHDMKALVGLSLSKAGRLYGVVYPRDLWWVKAGVAVANFFQRLLRRQFRVFVHPTEEVDGMVRSSGWQRRFYHTTALWQVVVYAR
jgi:magnesium-protoporphyrin O-methyltransferase